LGHSRRTKAAQQRLIRQKKIEASEDCVKETPEQYKARIARVRDLSTERGIAYNLHGGHRQGSHRTRNEHDHNAILERRRLVAKLHRDAETPEDAEIRRAKLRMRWRARVQAMSEEERLEFVRERNRKWFKDRPDRLERHRELSREARARWLARESTEDRAKRNERVRQARLERIAAMTPEEREGAKIARREKHNERMKDPGYAERWRTIHAAHQRKYRESKLNQAPPEQKKQAT